MKNGRDTFQSIPESHVMCSRCPGLRQAGGWGEEAGRSPETPVGGLGSRLHVRAGG